MNISGVVIEIQGKKYAIDMEQAKELHRELDNLFGSGPTYLPYYVPNPMPVISPQPYYNDHDMWRWNPVTTVYGNETAAAMHFERGCTTNLSSNFLNIELDSTELTNE